jgi:hypothetical protein
VTQRGIEPKLVGFFIEEPRNDIIECEIGSRRSVKTDDEIVIGRGKASSDVNLWLTTLNLTTISGTFFGVSILPSYSRTSMFPIPHVTLKQYTLI